MVETIQKNGLWHVALAKKDLIDKAGLNERDLEYMVTHLLYKDRKVIVSHSYNEHLVVSMEGKEDEDLQVLMNAFSKIVEYQPFCKYNLLIENHELYLPTYEWDKINPKERFSELSIEQNISNLVLI
jgi:hypothetical protein